MFLREHPHHAASIELFHNCSKETASCAAHSLAEVYATLTRLPHPHRARGSQALQFVEAINQQCTLVSLTGDIYVSTIRAAVTNQISGGTIYDFLLAECALHMNVEAIYTWNARHFQLFGDEIVKRLRNP